MKKLTLDQMRRALADKGVKGYADGNTVAPAKKAPQQVFDTVTQTFITPNENIAGIRLDDQGRTAQDKQKENLYRQLDAMDAWNTAGATREGAEAPWLMDQANRMMAVGVKDDFTGSGPGVVLYDPAKRQSEIVSSGNLSSWFERGDPAAAYEQAKNSLPYFQQKALLGIKGPTTQAQERRIVKTMVNNPLPALPFIEYGLGQFAPPNYGLDVNVSRRRAENKLLNRKEKPFEYFQDFLNLTPYQGPKPTIYQFPELTGYAEGGIASLAGGGGMPNIIGQKTAAAPYQVYDKASDTYRYVDAAGYEKWLSGIPLTPINTVPGSPVYYGAPSKAEGDYDIGGGGLSYIPEEPPPPPRYDIYGNQLQDDPYLKTLTEGETKDLESLGAFDPEARARLLEPLKNSLMPENAAGFLDVQQMLRNMYNDPEQRKVFDQYVDDLKYAPYRAREWFEKKIEPDKRSEEEGFAPDREYMPITGIELSQVNREKPYLPRDIANEMQRLVDPNTPDTVVKNFGDVKGNLAEDYVVTDRGQAIEPNSGSTVDKLYGGTPLSEMGEREGLEQGGGGASGGSVRKFRYLPRKQPMDIKKFGFAKGGPTIDEMRYRLLKRKG